MTKSQAKSREYIDCHMHLWSPYLESCYPQNVKSALEKLMREKITPQIELVPDNKQEKQEYEKPKDGNAKTLVHALDQAKFAKGVAFSGAYFWGSPLLPRTNLVHRVQEENNYAASQGILAKGRLIVVASINPLLDFALQEVDRCALELHMKGLKVHFNVAQIEVKNAKHRQRLKDLFQKAATHNMPVAIHYHALNKSYDIESFSLFMDDVILPISNLKVQFAHVLGTCGFPKMTQRIMQKLKEYCDRNAELKHRIWVDISGSIIDEPTAKEYEGFFTRSTKEEIQNLAKTLRAFGLKNVLFGSDYGGSATLQPKPHSELMCKELGFNNEELEEIFSNEGPW